MVDMEGGKVGSGSRNDWMESNGKTTVIVQKMDEDTPK